MTAPPAAPRRRFSIAIRLATAAFLTSAGWTAPAEALEYAVKATFLYKFAPFVAWPPEAFESPASPLHICVVGQNPFEERLARAIAGQDVGGRPLRDRYLDRAEPGSGCHIMYFGVPYLQTVAESLAAVQGEPVLTVTDQWLAPEVRGIVHFRIRDGRVRFEIDDTAAAASGLTISSKLLELALSVRRRERSDAN